MSICNGGTDEFGDLSVFGRLDAWLFLPPTLKSTVD